MHYYDSFPNRRRRPHRPLRTLDEMAEEFGITKSQLVSDMRRSPVKPPAQQLRHYGSLSPGHTWYDPVLMRRWRKAHLEAAQPARVAA